MPSLITDSFTADHHRCDRLLAQAERQVAAADWPTATVAARALTVAMERHFALEVGVLHPMVDGALPTRGAAIAALSAPD